jgi:hypothetical protein
LVDMSTPCDTRPKGRGTFAITMESLTPTVRGFAIDENYFSRQKLVWYWPEVSNLQMHPHPPDALPGCAPAYPMRHGMPIRPEWTLCFQDPLPKENPDMQTVMGAQKIPPYEVTPGQRHTELTDSRNGPLAQPSQATSLSPLSSRGGRTATREGLGFD